MKRSPIKKISKKQAKNNTLEAKIKRELMEKQIMEYGYNFCQCGCGRNPDIRGVQLSHEIPKSRGGKTDMENCILRTGNCHSKVHGINEV